MYMYIYIYIYTLYDGSIQAKPECSISRKIYTMVWVIKNAILICYSEFHALVIVKDILCLFYLKR